MIREKLEQHIPDDFDNDCTIINNALHNLSKQNASYKIEVLEQCIDYLKLEEWYENNKQDIVDALNDYNK